MSREEDFSDIPELGPADEDRLHKSIPTLESSQSVKSSTEPLGQARQQAAVQRKKASPLLWVLVLLLAAGLGYSVYQQILLQKQLGYSEDVLLQTQSRLADLESLVNATDESTSKTGAAFLAQLKRQQADRSSRIAHVDSEIRKLWAVYQKHKPLIEGLDKNLKSQQQQLAAAEKQLDGQKKELAGQQKELKTVGGSLDTVGVSLNKNREELAKLSQSAKENSSKFDKDINELKESLRLQDLEQQETNDLQEAEIADLKAKLAKADGTKALQAKLSEHQKALDSINASRRQINAEILKLRNQLGRLQAGPAS